MLHLILEKERANFELIISIGDTNAASLRRLRFIVSDTNCSNAIKIGHTFGCIMKQIQHRVPFLRDLIVTLEANNDDPYWTDGEELNCPFPQLVDVCSNGGIGSL